MPNAYNQVADKLAEVTEQILELPIPLIELLLSFPQEFTYTDLAVASLGAAALLTGTPGCLVSGTLIIGGYFLHRKKDIEANIQENADYQPFQHFRNTSFSLF